MRGTPVVPPAAMGALIGLLLSAAGTQAPAIFTLTATHTVRGRLAPGDQHHLTVVLDANTATSIVVQQKGIDVDVLVRDVDAMPLANFQDEVRLDGEERVEIVAERSGTYTIDLEAADSAVVAGNYVARMAPSRAATTDDRRLQESRALRTRGRQLERAGRFDAAQLVLERSLAVAESVCGDDEPSVALVQFDLAGNSLERQDDARARDLYDRAIGTFEKTWGPSHPYPAMARSWLALLDERAGQGVQAEITVRQVLPILERTVGPAHPWYLQTLATLANLRTNAGDLQEAERIERAALATLDNTHQTGTILEATLVNDLANVLRVRHDYAHADPLFRKSLAIGESILGRDSLFVATALQNLGIMAREHKDYPEALASYRRAIAIRERLLGPDHPALAGVLTNIANVYRALGDNQQALTMHFGALRLWEKSVGPYGQETLLVVGNIARTYAGAGDIGNALVYQRRADAILERQLSLYVASGSERQKLAFVQAEAERTDRTLSLHLEQAPNTVDAASLAALVLLQRKGRVQDAMMDLFAAAREHVADPGDRRLMDQLKESSATLARIAFGGMGPGDADVRASVARLESRREELERSLSQRSVPFRAQIQPVTLEAVQAAIPGDAALVEFAVFRPFDPHAERNEDAYGPPHYAAYVVSKHRPPAGIDVGAVEDVDPLVLKLRTSLRDPNDADVKSRARALDEKVMRPLRPFLNGAARLLISPDGRLNLVPFETLVDEHGRYLIERYATTYLTSGRDVLRMRIAPASTNKPIIFADPLFGEPATAPAARASTPERLRSVAVGSDVSGLYFAPLFGSALEARAIKSLFPDARVLTGRGANKAALERMTAPSILHIASHGFFLDNQFSGASAAGVAENPLLRSGLALAGANLQGDVHADGILTALEASSLNLRGTSLVTLSACDTGVGDVRNGEGVYGLRRAFTLAGAETVVMSLWPVTDTVARDTMVGYYARLRAGFGRGDALRQAKLAILRHTTLRHPYYWGGFIQSGDWTALRIRH